MTGVGIILIIFGILIILAGFYLIRGNKSDLVKLLLWRMDTSRMSISEIKYTGKILMSVGLAPIISGIVALFVKEGSIIPMIILGITVVLFLIISMKIFK